MSSSEIKEAISNYFDCTGVPNNEKDWKRLSKTRLSNGEWLREFENKSLGLKVYTLGEDEDASIIEQGQWIYGTYRNEDDELTFMFEPLARWQRQGHSYDQHQSHIIETMFLLPSGLFDEVMENAFVLVDSKYDDLTIHMLLKKHGLVHDQSYTDFILTAKNSPSSVVSLNRPFPVLDPNWGKALAPAATPVPVPAPAAPTSNLGGFKGTGLEADGSAKPSDFVACVVQDDEEVLVMISPLLDFCAGNGFDQSIGSLVDHLLPSDWDETSEQTYIPGNLCVVEAFEVVLKAGFHVDLPAFKKQFTEYYDIYDVTREQHQANLDAIRNPVSTMPQHHVNPIVAGPTNSNYPELSGQEEEVQEALEKARQQGVRGLEQENHNWLDMDEISERVDQDFYALRHDGIIELERSHVLWLLYEHYDNGSGLAFPNFFGMDNVRLEQEFCKIAPFDVSPEPEDGENDDVEDLIVNIIEDQRNYPSPYDLEVPEYVAPMPIIQAPVIQTTKVPPRPTKSSASPRPLIKGPFTGGGSFAGVQGTPAAPQEEEAPADATRIAFDSGEQWPEFCGAVWEHFKAVGTSAIQWSDRFRPRFARIIGLGYKFDRVEFTGIRVHMGYLNEKMEIIDNIDIPSAVFDELFEHGGDWNDDSNIQMINKKPGVDEDGFSYSSANMWEEVEPMLRSKGWLPAK